MQRKQLLVFGAVIWLGIAAAIVADGCIATAEFEASMEEGREWNREHPDSNESYLETGYFVPRINMFLAVPLLVAGALTGFGRWKTGLIFGIPAVLTSIWMLWTWYQQYLEIQRFVTT